MRISDWSSDVCSSDLCTFWPRPTGNSTTIWSTESTGSDSGRMCATPLPAMSGHLLVGGTGGGDQDLGPCRDEREEAGRKVRSEERRVGKECGRQCRYRWSPDH